MKMHKSLMLALAPMILLAASVRGADDGRNDQVSGLNIDNIVDAEIAIEEFDFDDVDVDSLAASAGADNEEAIEACFRRIGYGHSYGGGWGYGSSYGSCYYPSYSYGCHWQTPCYTEYRPLYTYRTCYTTYQYTPVYTSYWGCY
jgi:hypothetical protein